MKPHVANQILALVLIAMSAWGYFASDTPSMTALIPGIFGLVFILLHSPFKRENKVVAHVIVVLTLLLAISLIMPLKGTISRGDTAGTIRVAIMLIMAIVALITYIKSFIDVRKQRSA
ncbi:MAG: hypothetical protein KTR24_11710 [Saprospiraceae bacterium]|nr:hypothetical protein [Saprospiraceae bacterium]